MRYRIAPLHCRPWLLNGISARLIESHYENNYGGALVRLNALTQELETLDPALTPGPAINRLKRDQLIALNSTLLHELYFASIGGDGRALPQTIADALARDFGSADRWRHEFAGLAAALAGGSGWVLLSYVPRDGALINHTASDHGQSIAGAIPILALDMYEHAYHLEFGANATAYIAAFMRNIDWRAAEARYEDAIGAKPPRPLAQTQFADVPAIAAEDVKSLLDQGARVQILDVRPRHYTTRAQDMMEAAVWRDPERVDEWIGGLSKSDPVVTLSCASAPRRARAARPCISASPSSSPTSTPIRSGTTTAVSRCRMDCAPAGRRRSPRPKARCSAPSPTTTRSRAAPRSRTPASSSSRSTSPPSPSSARAPRRSCAPTSAASAALPASIRATSSMSLMMSSRCVPLRPMSRTYSV